MYQDFRIKTLNTLAMNCYKKIIILLVYLTILYAPLLYGQDRPDPVKPDNENLEVPARWNVRLDHPDEDISIGSDSENSDIYFVNMVPGWHITTGPAAIFWHPGSTAEGSYRAETVIHLFDPKGRNEAFGMFIGGTDLNGENRTYSYFLLRNSGEYLIKNREGERTAIVKNWSPAPSMKTYGDNTKTSVINKLAVEVGENDTAFFVNEEKVATLSKEKLYTDGTVGLRVNHRLNVHVEDLGVTGLK